jgi:3-hydroxyisobutyrate dehydrogenase-like beta-hydroxyacid dehydrogenase
MERFWLLHKMSNIKSISILGVGKMGSAIAKELVAAGFKVILWNRNQDVAEKLVSEINSPLLTCSTTPKLALAEADLAICLFTNGKVTQSVLLDDNQVLDGVKDNLIIVDMGTSGVESAQALASALALKKIAFIDAPVSGSVATIAAHQLLVMASGDEDVIKQVIPVFSVFAKKTAYLGKAGAGQSMKLAVNLIVHSLNAAVSEALALATANGIQASDAYDVFEDSVIAAPFVKYKRAAFLDPEFAVAMRIDTVLKDLELILGLGRSVGLPLTAASGVHELFTHAQEAGFEAKDMAALFTYIRQT